MVYAIAGLHSVLCDPPRADETDVKAARLVLVRTTPVTTRTAAMIAATTIKMAIDIRPARAASLSASHSALSLQPVFKVVSAFAAAGKSNHAGSYRLCRGRSRSLTTSAAPSINGRQLLGLSRLSSPWPRLPLRFSGLYNSAVYEQREVICVIRHPCAPGLRFAHATA
jgi:hypothetical protein